MLRRTFHASPKKLSTRPVESENVDESGAAWGEIRGGRDLHPAADGSWWSLFRGEDITVSAVPVHHTVPCLGFVIREDDKDGRLQVEKVLPQLNANAAAIREQYD